jgi:hypothetical protein
MKQAAAAHCYVSDKRDSHGSRQARIYLDQHPKKQGLHASQEAAN